ncbi:endo alpha-1,4 polygalactosaminidase [Frigoribacterium sp. VKM Ac-2836]|uniref:endo alpha-1,4 polygalactosaminidase n=1 Tax=Frigoribacterium sp. VKM Ac-2836 TaxID=2739014 RepID=UPI0015637DF4|nr:endo alpha-1,4 polygalactosaminidase [Frigoribacterium sp. VKM Ac-2836]NRD27332.1 endo alpha-1,4 polygalactosaminidase [Frigoribacterium sp. VKM Ac-2836]
MRAPLGLVGLVAVALAVTGCTTIGAEAGERPERASSSAVATPGTPAVDGVDLPPEGARFDYQLGGASPVPDGATVVARDSTDDPAQGAYGICYVNGFQTQPGAEWPDELLVRTADGEPLVDPGWPDEHLFDLSTETNRQAVAERQASTIEGCATSGYRAVEFDNLDSWTRSEGAFGEDEAVAFATLLVARAHAAGLATAQKNTADLGTRGRDEVGYDFAVTEECDRYDECDAYTDVFGGLVFDVEYTDALRGSVEQVCARIDALDPAPSTIVRDHDLVPADDSAHAYTAC